MSEFDQDALLTGAFSEFSAAAAPSVRPLGTQAVRGEVAHRRKVRAVALSVVAALVVAVPVASYAAFGRDSQAPPTPGSSVTPTISETPTETPSASPSAPAIPAPDGRITIAQLTAGKVDVPKWSSGGTTPDGSCNDGQIKLGQPESGSHHNPTLTSYVQQVAYANFDADGALETAALLKCAPGEAKLTQVVVFDRDAAGKIVTQGRLFAGSIWSVKANPAGGVDLDVSDSQACCDTPKATELHQIRTFGWNGAKLAQLAGPTSFTTHSKPIDLQLTVKSATWGPSAGGYRTGTVVVVIKNASSTRSNSFIILQKFRPTDYAYEIYSPLAGGASRQITITVRQSEDGINNVVIVHELGGVADANVENNWKSYPLW
jgi:hypothetical protein